MALATENVNIVCEIGGDENTTYLNIKLMNGIEQISLLEFADITDELKSLIEINSNLKLYESVDELKNDLAQGYLATFLNKKSDNTKIVILNNIKMRINHQNGLCEYKCIYCNPDLGEETFPDFTAKIKNLDIKGEA